MTETDYELNDAMEYRRRALEDVESCEWDFRDEALGDELHRALSLAREMAQRADRAEAKIKRMMQQHDDFIDNFGVDR